MMTIMQKFGNGSLYSIIVETISPKQGRGFQQFTIHQIEQIFVIRINIGKFAFPKIKI